MTRWCHYVACQCVMTLCHFLCTCSSHVVNSDSSAALSSLSPSSSLSTYSSSFYYSSFPSCSSFLLLLLRLLLFFLFFFFVILIITIIISIIIIIITIAIAIINHQSTNIINNKSSTIAKDHQWSSTKSSVASSTIILTLLLFVLILPIIINYPRSSISAGCKQMDRGANRWASQTCDQGNLPTTLRSNRQERNMPSWFCMWLLPHDTRQESDWLVVWNMFLFLHILGIIIPTDKYFSEGLKPPTRWDWTSASASCWSTQTEDWILKIILLALKSDGTAQDWSHSNAHWWILYRPKMIVYDLIPWN